jgi:hypothetical protein
MKKIYSKPEILVVESQIECSILAGSKLRQRVGESNRTESGSSWVIDGDVKNNDASDNKSVFGKATGGLWE